MKSLVFTALTAAIGYLSVTGATVASSEPLPTTCVAVMETEVLADLPGEDRKALAGALDTLLVENLAKQKGLVLVERQALDRVLTEKAGAAGMPSFQPFWSAGVLICPSMELAEPEKPATSPVLISLEAVAAQTGQMLAEVHVVGQLGPSGWAAPPLSDAQWERFWLAVGDNASHVKGLPLVEVADTQLQSATSRLQWMADDLVDTLRAAVAASRRAALLVPRRPISTREERLLRMMGLAAAKTQDSAARLAPTADARVAVEVTEEPGTGVAFEKTPIRIQLQWQRRDVEPASRRLDGTVGQYEDFRKQAVSWLNERLATGTANRTPPADEESGAQKQAEAELAAARQLVATFGAIQPVEDIGCSWSLSPRKQSLRAAIGRRALRASHLDPTSEEAAFLAAMTVDSFYFLQGQERSQACRERLILECQRYLDQFPKPAASRNHTFQVLSHLDGLIYQALGELRGPSGGWADARDRALAYRYADIALPAMGEVDVVAVTQEHWGQDNLWVLAHVLTETIFLLCPDNELEAQYRRWHDFWQKRLVPLKNDEYPAWEYASLGYQVRKKDVQGLRTALTVLERKGPQASKWLWEDPNSPARARKYLREAGDPEWRTWRPPLSSAPEGVYRLVYKESQAFCMRLCPPMPTVEENGWQSPPFLADQTVEFPKDVVQYGESARYGGGQAAVEPLCAVAGEIWFTAPGLLRRDMLINLHKDFVLYTANAKAVDQGTGRAAVELMRVPWPDRPASFKKNGQRPLPLIALCAAVGDGPQGPRVWIGTHYHGAACFWKESGRWRGRWYGAEAGLPEPSVRHITSCLHEGKPKMLLTMTNSDVVTSPTDEYLAALDLDTGKATILLSTGGRKELMGRQLAAVESDGRRVPILLYQRTLWPTLDLKDVKQYVGFAWGPWPAGGPYLWTSGRDAQIGRPRIWAADPTRIGELDPNTLATLPRQLTRRETSGTIFYDDQTWFIASIHLHASLGALPWHQISAPTIGECVCSTGEANVAWGVLSGCLMAYRVPTTDGEWIQNDRWYGPMKPPDIFGVTAIMPAAPGRLYVATNGGVMHVVSCRRVMAEAEGQQRAYSTAQWQQKYRQVLQRADWTCMVRSLITERKWQDALTALDAAPVAQDDERVLLYRALTLARMGKREAEAAKLYAQIIDSPSSCPTAKAIAMVNRIKVLHVAGQWQEMLEASDRFCHMFPELKPSGSVTEHLDWYRNDARTKLAAVQRNPVASPAPKEMEPKR